MVYKDDDLVSNIVPLKKETLVILFSLYLSFSPILDGYLLRPICRKILRDIVFLFQQKNKIKRS